MPKSGTFLESLGQIDGIALPARPLGLSAAEILPETTPFGMLVKHRWVISGVLRFSSSLHGEDANDELP